MPDIHNEPAPTPIGLRRIARVVGDAALPPHLRGGVVAIGNFDGVHLGHRAVLDAAIERARRLGLPALVQTFEPHPRELFGGEPVFRLTPPAKKAELLAILGFDAVIETRFDRDFAASTAEEFVRNVLVEGLAARHVVVGHDFRYGAMRAGDAEALARDDRFETTIVEAELDGADAVSSSRIRDALAKGDCVLASRLLGWRWCVDALVEHGRKVGRTLGYPTANMTLPDGATLAHGIYAVRFRRVDGALLDGVASYGRRPTFDDGAPLLETFVFDFEGDLYGEMASVALFERLRGEERFDGVDALIEQMDRDAADARTILARARPLGEIDAALNFA